MKNMTHRNRIKHVSIRGFRSLMNVELGLRDLNILIGPNGSGKSNFISFFQMLNYALTESLQFYIQTRGFGESMLYMGSRVTPVLDACLVMEGESAKNEYKFRMAHAAPDTLIYTSEETDYHREGAPEPLHRIFDVGGKESAIIRAAQGEVDDPYAKSARFIRNALSAKRVYQFHDTSLAANIRKSTDLFRNRYLYSDAGNLAAILYDLKIHRNPYYQRIVSALRRVIPSFQDLILEPEKNNADKIMLRWLGADSNYEFGPHQFSDGSLRFMSLATLLLQPEDNLPDMIIIDEPELGLHPAAEAILVGLIQSVSKICQVVIATQSATFVDAFVPEDVIVTEMKDGATSFKRQSSTDLKDWLEDYTLGQVWQKNLMGGRP